MRRNRLRKQVGKSMSCRRLLELLDHRPGRRCTADRTANRDGGRETRDMMPVGPPSSICKGPCARGSRLRHQHLPSCRLLFIKTTNSACSYATAPATTVGLQQGQPSNSSINFDDNTKKSPSIPTPPLLFHPLALPLSSSPIKRRSLFYTVKSTTSSLQPPLLLDPHIPLLFSQPSPPHPPHLHPRRADMFLFSARSTAPRALRCPGPAALPLG